MLLGPIMIAMWLATSLLIWALVPNIPFLHALAIGSCVTPTVSNGDYPRGDLSHRILSYRRLPYDSPYYGELSF